MISNRGFLRTKSFVSFASFALTVRMECEELGSCSSVCDAFVWGAVGGVSDALETLFARAVFGVYEGGTSWGGARLEHEGGLSICTYIYGARHALGGRLLFVFMRARFCFLHTLLYVEVLHWTEAWGFYGYMKRGRLWLPSPFVKSLSLYIYLSLCSMLSCGGFKPDTP